MQSGRPTWWAIPSGQAAGSCSNVRMADAEIGNGRAGLCDLKQGKQRGDIFTNRSAICGLADSSECGIRTRDGQSCESLQREGSNRGHGFSCGMDDAGGTRLEGYAGDADDKTGRQEQNGPAPASGGTGGSCPTNGFWGAADWLLCRDGKWRPVEPGTFPLADGTPQRVGRLRGYGNAIVAPQAAAFIKAFMEWKHAYRS